MFAIFKKSKIQTFSNFGIDNHHIVHKDNVSVKNLLTLQKHAL